MIQLFSGDAREVLATLPAGLFQLCCTSPPYFGLPGWISHFASYPEKLVRPILLMGASAAGQCSACGAPYRRVVEKGAPAADQMAACGADAAGGYEGLAQKDYAPAKAQDASATKARILAGMRQRTSTWVPGCDCQAPARPCRVVDPFGGTGTTALVAHELGLDATIIDLNPDYTRLARARLEAAGASIAPEPSSESQLSEVTPPALPPAEEPAVLDDALLAEWNA